MRLMPQQHARDEQRENGAERELNDRDAAITDAKTAGGDGHDGRADGVGLSGVTGSEDGHHAKQRVKIGER